MKNRLTRSLEGFLIAGTVAISSVALSSCEKKGPAEEMGEKIDETVEEAGEAVEEATDN